ncbi:PAS domain S-box protein [Clostridium chromiireducens]|uniref:PAS domain S-box protein n=1 Tax=Clostridium chromiireducens TaxID=225345 RepID=UPI003AF476D3
MSGSILEDLSYNNIFIGDNKMFLRSKELIENTLDIILVVDKDGRILYGNKKAIEIYGYSFDELTNLDVFTLRNEDTREFTKKQLNKALDRGIKFKTYHYRKDGSKFPVEVRSIYSNKKSKDMVVSIIRDISDMEKVYKDARIFSISLDIIDDPFIIFNKDIDISYWSKGAETTFGFKKEEVIGKNMSQLLSEEILEESRKLIDMLSQGKIVKDYETVRFAKDGTIVNLSISASPIYDENGAFSGVTAIYRDITDRKLIEKKLVEKCEQLELLKERAEYANKAKSIFLANISHELRTPMNGILAGLQLIKLEDNNEEQAKYIKILNDSANTMLRVINNLLDVSKIESGGFKLNSERFNLRETINNIYNSLLITGNIKGLEVVYYLDPNIDFDIIGDQVKLKEILSNLITNAVRFTNQGHVSFRVKVISQDEYSEKIEFRIKDSGNGIDENFRDRIFNAFSQGDLSTRNEYIGVGLSLSISKHFAALMNGDICFEKNEDKGSTFIFTCEFQKNKTKKHRLKTNSMSNNKITREKIDQDKVILYVEDNLISQEVMESILKSKGYKYIAAYNGNEALHILRNNKVDIILMDIQMPELNGFETTKIIRDEGLGGKHIPIIAITAYAMREDKEKCIQANMDDYLVKPFEVEKLYEIIEFNLRK